MIKLIKEKIELENNKSFQDEDIEGLINLIRNINIFPFGITLQDSTVAFINELKKFTDGWKEIREEFNHGKFHDFSLTQLRVVNIYLRQLVRLYKELIESL